MTTTNSGLDSECPGFGSKCLREEHRSCWQQVIGNVPLNQDGFPACEVGEHPLAVTPVAHFHYF